MADGWSVINQEQVIGKLPDNTYGPVVRVTYRTTAGVVRSTDVPVKGYNAEAVAAQITAEVAEIEAVSGL